MSSTVVFHAITAVQRKVGIQDICWSYKENTASEKAKEWQISAGGRINCVRWPSVLVLNVASSTASFKICGNREVANSIAVSEQLNPEY